MNDRSINNKMSFKKLKELANKAVSKIDEVATSVGIGKVEKTQDPRYDEAKKLFKNISIDSEKIVGGIIQYEGQLKNLADLAVKLTVDLNQWFQDAPNPSTSKITTLQSLSKDFDITTNNFFCPRLEPHVIKHVSQFHAEVERLRKIKSQRSKARKDYDVARTQLSHAVEHKFSSETISTFDNKARECREKYTPLNEDFISSVHKLVASRSNLVERPIRNLLCLQSQYMMHIFTELQKLRSVFPPETFVPRTVVQPPSVSAPQPVNPQQNNPYANEPNQNQHPPLYIPPGTVMPQVQPVYPTPPLPPNAAQNDTPDEEMENPYANC